MPGWHASHSRTLALVRCPPSVASPVGTYVDTQTSSLALGHQLSFDDVEKVLLPLVPPGSEDSPD
jgi:hypothetical protein